jgi:hypothetical protein
MGVTIRARRGSPIAPVVDEIRGTGIAVVEQKSFEHAADTTFELRLMGPAKQFDVATARLLERAEVLSVQFD